MLENLTSKFSAPSVLDLKIGTRQHGDDVPEEKVKKHKETCANSTSRTLGVRICGLQVSVVFMCISVNNKDTTF